MKKIQTTLLFAIISMYGVAQPVISGFFPASGAVGTLVTITGSGFNSSAAANVVYFGATAASVSAATATSLTVTVPYGATFKSISVTDLGTSLTGYSAKPFLVTYSGCGLFDSTMFAPRVGFPSTDYARALVICDLNNDNRADMVTANRSGSISLFKNTGGPGITFAPKTDIPAGVSFDLSYGDFDGDGRLDIAASDAVGNAVSVFLNTSTTSTISLAPKIDFVVGTGPQSVTVADVDGDGKPDIIAAGTGANSISVLRNTTSGGSVSFAPKIDYATAYYPTHIITGDVDGDGKPEIAVANEGAGSVSVFRNFCVPGTVSFATGLIVPAGASPLSGLAIGDIDGDSKSDLVVSRSDVSCSYAVLRNTSLTGSISFAAPSAFGVTPTCSTTNPYGVQVSDIDGDGKLDVVLNIVWESMVVVYKNTSSPGSISLTPGVGFGVGVSNVELAIGDLDNDGLPDIAVPDDNHTYTKFISVLRNIQCTAGIESNSASETDFMIYPNPFSEAASIVFNHERQNVRISIVDITGKEVRSLVFSGKELEIRKEDLNPGMYFVKAVTEENQVLSRKIIIQ